MLRERGTLGLIATNTIAQGDTRASGLRPIRQQGGTIYRARRRYVWPGQAAVVVSVVHIAKALSPPSELDGQPVERITAFLVDRGGDDDPRPLAANQAAIHELALRLAAETERAHLMSDPDVIEAIELIRILHPLAKTDPASYLLGYIEAVRRGR